MLVARSGKLAGLVVPGEVELAVDGMWGEHG